MKKAGIGIVGAGAISGIYLQNLTGVFSDLVEVTAVADVVPERAKAACEQYAIATSCSTEQIMKRDDVEIILNLTTPEHHSSIATMAVDAGKHVYNEKPLCVTREEARALVEAANKRGVRVGCSPDTVLGAGVQTCRKLIDDGWIGEPVAASAFMANHGHESWHPDPEFYYKRGGGPLFDMGPYYLSTLVNLMGSVSRVSGSAKKSFETRTITSEAKYGTKIEVDVPTHIAGTLDFASGAVATLITSFDVWASTLPRVEIYGSAGSMIVPDPNTFSGPVMVRRAGASEWSEIPLTHQYNVNSRGLGVTDLACAESEGRDHRANARVAEHVLEVMHGIHDAAASGRYYEPQTGCERPQPMRMEGLK